MAVVMDADRMARTLTRIAHEILERNRAIDELALVGIRTRGVPLARRLKTIIASINQHEVPTGALDITLYRDDLMRHAVGTQPVVRSTDIPFSIDDKRILLVDDVLYTGRTIRAALDALIEFGRPQAIADTASCRSRPTTSARTCRPRRPRACRCISLKSMDATRWRSANEKGSVEHCRPLSRRDLPHPRHR
jgi:pyrimidine operon attenuation protein / uracil phosphoribosyltransferase